MKKKLVEPYLKEKNLIQLPIFHFERKLIKQTSLKWSDEEGDYKLECICKYGVPGAFEQDVYAACMRIWVKQGMPASAIELSYSDIARELNMYPKSFHSNIKKSLKKLAQARYEFTKCFLRAKDGKIKRVNTHFSLFDTASLFEFEKGENNKKTGRSRLVFPDEIRENIESEYYQYLDMAWYRSLPSGFPRRMYEYLAKKRYHARKNSFSISLDFMCRWLSVKDKRTYERRKRIEKTAQALIDAKYLLGYEYDKKRKMCIFSYGPAEKQQLLFDDLEDYENQVDDKSVIVETQFVPKKSETEPVKEPKTDILAYEDALKWIGTIKHFNKKRKSEIAKLQQKEVARVYPGIRSEYEQLDPTPKPGWIYKAFMESWEFVVAEEKPQDLFPDTPKGKKARQAKDIFESWDDSQREDFLVELRDYIGPSMENDKIDEFIENGKIWLGWGQMFMAALGHMEI